MLSNKFKPQHNETILSLHYCKVTRAQNKNAKEWIGYLKVKANEFRYKKEDKRLKEQFINSINDGDMIPDII